MKRLVLFVLVFLPSQKGVAQEAKPLPAADERYKADILLVVAHPDDEGAATPYLARALDEGKHVAVAFGTRGSRGGSGTSSGFGCDSRDRSAPRFGAVGHYQCLVFGRQGHCEPECTAIAGELGTRSGTRTAGADGKHAARG